MVLNEHTDTLHAGFFLQFLVDKLTGASADSG